MRLRGFGAVLLALSWVFSPAAASGDEPAVVSATQAGQRVGERCTVEMTVRASKNAAPRREYYLDSEEDFHSDDDFTVVVSYDHAEAFLKAGIDDPADYYKGKTLRVTGKVIRENDQIRIRVEDPKQIVVVEAKK